MMAAVVAVVLAAAPAWKVTFSTSHGSDHGNGVIVATSDLTTEVTPTEVRVTVEATRKGQPVKQKPLPPKPTPAAVREAIAALLPSLPKASGVYSTNPYVDDEGWSTEAIAVDVDGKSLQFSLQQGKVGPPVPPELQKLKALIAQATK